MKKRVVVGIFIVVLIGLIVANYGITGLVVKKGDKLPLTEKTVFTENKLYESNIINLFSYKGKLYAGVHSPTSFLGDGSIIGGNTGVYRFEGDGRWTGLKVGNLDGIYGVPIVVGDYFYVAGFTEDSREIDPIVAIFKCNEVECERIDGENSFKTAMPVLEFEGEPWFYGWRFSPIDFVSLGYYTYTNGEFKGISPAEHTGVPIGYSVYDNKLYLAVKAYGISSKETNIYNGIYRYDGGTSYSANWEQVKSIPENCKYFNGKMFVYDGKLYAKLGYTCVIGGHLNSAESYEYVVFDGTNWSNSQGTGIFSYDGAGYVADIRVIGNKAYAFVQDTIALDKTASVFEIYEYDGTSWKKINNPCGSEKKPGVWGAYNGEIYLACKFITTRGVAREDVYQNIVKLDVSVSDNVPDTDVINDTTAITNNTDNINDTTAITNNTDNINDTTTDDGVTPDSDLTLEDDVPDTDNTINSSLNNNLAYSGNNSIFDPIYNETEIPDEDPVENASPWLIAGIIAGILIVGGIVGYLAYRNLSASTARDAGASSSISGGMGGKKPAGKPLDKKESGVKIRGGKEGGTPLRR